MKPPDNAFIWLDIAKIDAFRLAGDTKEKKSISKVIFVSGVRGYAVEAFEHEADGFLLTPFRIDKINQLLQQNVKKMK